MNNHIYRIVDIAGSSTESVNGAIQNAIARAGQTLHNLEWFEVKELRGHIKDGKVAHYQVVMKVGFRLDEEGNEG